MPDTVQDFYAGYEGEPEFLFYLDGHLRLRCWDGHLDPLLESIPLDQGRWTGLAEAYHLDLWGEDSWQVTNNLECLTQLVQCQIDTDVSEARAAKAEEVLGALIDLFREAVAIDGQVIVQRD